MLSYDNRFVSSGSMTGNLLTQLNAELIVLHMGHRDGLRLGDGRLCVPCPLDPPFG